MLTIVDYRPEFARDFLEINLEWLKAMFTVEAVDLDILENPQERILDGGGHISVALLHGKPVGAGALRQTSPGCFELTKMGVRQSARGHGAGALLLRALVDKARELGAEELYLLSSHECDTAVAMYERFGFLHDEATRLRYGGEYERCTVGMRFPLSAEPAGAPG